MTIGFDCLALAPVLPRELPDRLDNDHRVWDRASFDLAIPMAITSLMILSLRFGSA